MLSIFFPHLLDGVEVRTVRRKLHHLDVVLLEELHGALHSVGTGTIVDDGLLLGVHVVVGTWC